MTALTRKTVVPAGRRDPLAALSRVATVVLESARTAAWALLDRIGAIADAGQLGADHETEIGRWSGARV